MVSSPAGAKALRLLANAYLIFAVAFAAFCTYASLHGHYTVPNNDDWRILDDLFSQPLLKWIFTDQVGHRFPTTLLLLYLDYTYFGGHMHLLAVAAVACTWIGAFALAAVFRAEPSAPTPADRAACGFCLFCLFWAGSSYDLMWGVNQGSQQTMALFAVSLALLARYRSRCAGAPPSAGVRLPVAAGATAVLATFSQGMGAASWAGLCFASIVSRVRMRVIAALLAAGTASVVLYGWGLQHAPYRTSWGYVRSVRENPKMIATFWLAFIGNPIEQVTAALAGFPRGWSFAVGKVGGVIGLVVFLSYSVHLLRRRGRASAVESVCAGLMAFTLAGGVLVAINRFTFPPTALAVRFVTWTTLFWIGAVVAVVRLPRGRAWGDWLAVVVLWVVSLAMIPGLQQAFSAHERVRQNLARHVAMLLSGVRWDKLARVGIDPNSEPVYRVADRMRRDRRGFFADGRGDLAGTRLAERFATPPRSSCPGTIDDVNEIAARDGPAAMVSGTLPGPSAVEAPSYLVLVDAAGVIRGVGELMPGTVGASNEWLGFIDDFVVRGRYTVYGVREERGAVCELASWPRPLAGRPRPPR